MVDWSSCSRKVAIIEPTISLERRCGDVNERKRTKHDGLLEESRHREWLT